MKTKIEVQWDIYMQYGRHIILTQGHMLIIWNYVYQCLWWHCWLHWVHVRYIYWQSYLIYVHNIISICGISMAFGGIFVVGTYMVIAWKIKVAIWWVFFPFWLVCAVIWGQDVDYIIRSHDQKKSCCISFWSSWLNRWTAAIDDIVGIMWPWLHHQ